MKGRWELEAWLRWPHILIRTGAPEPSMVVAAGRRRRIGLVVSSFLLAVQVASRTNLLYTGPGELLERMEEPLVLREPPLALPVIPVAALWPERLTDDAGHRWFREKVMAVVRSALESAGGAR